jgi:hypothetical protein
MGDFSRAGHLACSGTFFDELWDCSLILFWSLPAVMPSRSSGWQQRASEDRGVALRADGPDERFGALIVICLRVSSAGLADARGRCRPDQRRLRLPFVVIVLMAISFLMMRAG